MKKAIFIIITISFCSCWSTRAPMVKFEKSAMTPKTQIQLSGRFVNYPEGTDLNNTTSFNNINYCPLNRLIFTPFYRKTADIIDTYEGEIELNLLSETELEVRYLVGDKLVDTKTLKGTLYDNSFARNTRKQLIGLPLLYLKYESQKLYLGLTEENDLIVFPGRDFWVNYIFLCVSEYFWFYDYYVYKRVH